MENFIRSRFKPRGLVVVFFFLFQGITGECYALLLSVQIPNDSLFLNGNASLGKGDFSKADSLFKEGLESAKATNDSLWMGRFLNGIGSVKLAEKDLQEAIKHYLQGLDYLADSSYSADYAKLESNLGVIYSGLLEHTTAKKYFEHALSLLKQEDNLMLSIMSNLFGVYMALGDGDKAENTANKAIEMAERLGNKNVKAILSTNLSNFYLQKKDWSRAIQTGKESLKIREELQSGNLSKTLNNIGYGYFMLQDYDQAESYYLKALDDAGAMEEVQLLWNLQQNSQGKQDWAKASGYLEKYVQLKDSLNEVSEKANVLEITEKYESEKKELKIENLEAENGLQRKLIQKERILAGLIVLSLLVLMGFLLLLLKQRRTQQALEKSKLNQRFLLTQLNPHFIFNALQSIQNFIYREKKDKTAEYIAAFSKLIRSVLENSDKEVISITEEVGMIRHYLSLQQLSNDFDFNLTTSDAEVMEDCSIPGMFIQPFVENAILHGAGKREKGMVNLEFDLSEDRKILTLVISDNGTGMDDRDFSKTDGLHRSMSMEILRKRILEFNQSHREKILLSITDYSEDPEYPGTKVTFRFPVFH
ncbi:tetratricopeptide repeat-containing sensor histidine kinase [Algoriphagus sp.]|uniref:tetratricopeptide repeat-containing sensor histidine kinase n=1 Tax=Algoriphagus sp. TaxID=1872435 RepID=UPI003F6F65FF